MKVAVRNYEISGLKNRLGRLLFSHEEIKERLKLQKCPAILPGNLVAYLHGALRYWDRTYWGLTCSGTGTWLFFKPFGWQKNGHPAKLFLAFWKFVVITVLCAPTWLKITYFDRNLLQVVLSLRYSTMIIIICIYLYDDKFDDSHHSKETDPNHNPNPKPKQTQP